jgi:hypothetical protein
MKYESGFGRQETKGEVGDDREVIRKSSELYTSTESETHVLLGQSDQVHLGQL